MTPAHIVPEWYFLPFYAILRAIPDKLGGVLAMFGSIAVLVLPALARHLEGALGESTGRSYQLFFWLFVVVCIVLGWLGARPAEGVYVIMAQIVTLYYFAFFLVILPLLGLIETPRPLPSSITEAVLAKNKGGAVAMPAGAAARPRPRAERTGESLRGTFRMNRILERARCRGRACMRVAGGGVAARPKRAHNARRADAFPDPQAARRWTGPSPARSAHYDKAQLQRGLKVYKEVCSACHSHGPRRVPHARATSAIPRRR